MCKVAWLSLVMIVGCGGSDGGGGAGPHDAASDAPIDAMNDAMNDAAVDAPSDVALDGPVQPAAFAHYVLDHVSLPANNTQARDYGLDLDGDQVVDNQLGMVIAAFAAQGLDSQASMTSSVDRGDVIMLAALGADDFTTEPAATFTLYQGDNPMPAPCASPQDITCRRHLAGTGMFSIAASSPSDPPLPGVIAGGTLTAGPGHLTVQLMFGSSSPITFTLIGARVRLSTTGTSLTGKLAGAISQSEIDSKLVPAIAQSSQATVMEECTMLANPPTCGCPSASQSATLLGLFDTAPKDCTISTAEVQDNSLIMSLLAPDVMVEGMQALSLGVAVTAVHGDFTVPM